MTMPLPGALYITVGSRDTGTVGFTWRIWAGRTSFYLKSRASGLGHLKLSIHGEDPRHPSGGGYKLAMDTEELYQQAVDDGIVLADRAGDWPLWFPGRALRGGSTLVARLRWTWDACTRLPAAPAAGALRREAVGLVVPPPPQPGDAVDVELIVSEGEPYWPQEERARRDNACLGPLRNDADLWLTGVVIKRQASHHAPPEAVVPAKPRTRADEIRGVAAAVDPEGFAWLVEQRMSRVALEQAVADGRY